jgi:multisubunit Na+/H+ antiporter MnhB subunit
MNAVGMVFDWALAGAILITGALVLASPGFLRAVVLFVAFGLLMALAWVRLSAPDIALAEAAIGTGITGVLLMDAVRHMKSRPEAWQQQWLAPKPSLLRKGETALPTLGALAMGVILLAGVALLSPADPAMAERVSERMDYLEHPVTGVLLVFRSLDTLLELGILLLAVLGMLTVRGRRGLAAEGMFPTPDPVLAGVVRTLVPLAVLVAGYFLWLGTFAAGGAFQAGVVIGAVGILLWLSGHRVVNEKARWMGPLLVMTGFTVFIVVAIGTMIISGRMLDYPPQWMSALLQVMEVAAALSIGAALTALFVGLHPQPESLTMGGR